MATLCSRCTMKDRIFRPERCVVLDGKACAACTEDIELEKEIKELENLIEKIHIKRRALRTVMNENHDQLIHKFPPEIASQIFIQYAPQPGSFGEAYENSPLTLGAVCQEWRRRAWATPQLWTSVLVELRKVPPRKELPQLVAEWLERSAGLPLTITFTADSARIAGDDIYHEMATILNKHSARWEDVYFGLPLHHLHLLCGSSSSQGNIIRQLILIPPKDSNQRNRPQDASSTFSMKNKRGPRTLTLARIRLTHVDIIWNNLMMATLENLAVDECIELMRLSPLLAVLDLRSISTSSGTFPIPNTRISFPELLSLEMTNFNEERVVAQFLDSLCLPSLDFWGHEGCGLPLANMLSFIEYSSFSLTSFTIGGRQGTYERVHHILGHLPSLGVLQMRFWFYSLPQAPAEEFLNLLCSTSESPPFLPSLQLLEIGVHLPFSWESVSRIFASPHRKSLVIAIDYHSDTQYARMTNESADLLLELVDQGFQLSVVKDGKVDILRKWRNKKRRAAQAAELPQ